MRVYGVYSGGLREAFLWANGGRSASEEGAEGGGGEGGLQCSTMICFPLLLLYRAHRPSTVVLSGSYSSCCCCRRTEERTTQTEYGLCQAVRFCGVAPPRALRPPGEGLGTVTAATDWVVARRRIFIYDVIRPFAVSFCRSVPSPIEREQKSSSKTRYVTPRYVTLRSNSTHKPSNTLYGRVCA